MTSEAERIARIAAILRDARASAVKLDIGDDAAVVDAPAEPLVLTVDEQVEGTHFTRALCSLEDVGFRATMAAASDLAAMGAKPLCAVAAWVLPASVTDDDVEQIARGQRQASEAVGASIVGGNLARGPAISIATTWVGTTKRPVSRSGAVPGDGLWVCGDLGLAFAGFRALSGRAPSERREALAHVPEAAVVAFRRPVARVEAGLLMAKVAHAAIDVSDGLAVDAGRLATSSAVRVVLDESAVRKCLHSATIAIAQMLGEDPLDFALGGGEDYAVLCASAEPIDGFTRIGVIEGGAGCVIRNDAGALRPAKGGFDHFASLGASAADQES